MALLAFMESVFWTGRAAWKSCPPWSCLMENLGNGWYRERDLNLAASKHEREECRRTGGIRNTKKSPCSLSMPFPLFWKLSLSGKCEIERWLWTTDGDESQAELGQALTELVQQESMNCVVGGCWAGNRPEVWGIWGGWMERVREHGPISTEKETESMTSWWMLAVRVN